MPHSGRVLIVGTVALDTVETPLGRVENALGGSAVYASVAASYFARVSLIGAVGEDFPVEHVEMLKTAGVDTHGLQTHPGGATFRWSGRYDYDANQAQTLATHLNVLETFHPRLSEEHQRLEFVFLANMHPKLQLSVLEQADQPTLTFADTMNFWIEHEREALLEVLRRVDVIFMNDAEARELCGTFSLVRAGEQLLAMGPQAVVIKKGEHGALMFRRDGHFSVPSYPLENVADPTGAGDSFAGGFIGSLASERRLNDAAFRRAAVRGSVIASYTVEDFSLGRLCAITRDDLTHRFREFRRFTYFEE